MFDLSLFAFSKFLHCMIVEYKMWKGFGELCFLYKSLRSSKRKEKVCTLNYYIKAYIYI